MYATGRTLLTQYDTGPTTGDSRMAKELPSLGDFELQVLRLVWEHQPCTERQIWDLVQEDSDLARTTVLKTIQRLEAKGLLVRVPGEGRPVRFRAAVDE